MALNLEEVIAAEVVSRLISENAEAQDTGDMKRSRKVTGGAISYSVPYAEYVHQMRDVKWSNKDTKLQAVTTVANEPETARAIEETVAKFFNRGR